MVGEGDAKGRMKRHFSLIVFEKRQVKLLTVYHCAFFFFFYVSASVQSTLGGIHSCLCITFLFVVHSTY